MIGRPGITHYTPLLEIPLFIFLMLYTDIICHRITLGMCVQLMIPTFFQSFNFQDSIPYPVSTVYLFYSYTEKLINSHFEKHFPIHTLSNDLDALYLWQSSSLISDIWVINAHYYKWTYILPNYWNVLSNEDLLLCPWLYSHHEKLSSCNSGHICFRKLWEMPCFLARVTCVHIISAEVCSGYRTESRDHW